MRRSAADLDRVRRLKSGIMVEMRKMDVQKERSRKLGRRRSDGRRKLSQQARGHLAMLGFSLAIAGSFSLGGRIANDIDPVALTAARFAASAALLFLVTLFGSGSGLQVSISSWRHIVAAALTAIFFVMMFEGLKTAPAVSMSAILTLIPAMSAVFGWMLLRQVATGRMKIALLIGGIGAVWVIFRADLASMLELRLGRGEAIFLLGCAAYALYTPFVRKFHRGEPAAVFALNMTAFGTVLLLAFGWQEIAETDWTSLPTSVWAALAYLTVFATVISFGLLNYASLRLPSAKVMAYTYLTPSWVIVWESLLGDGRPSSIVLIGVAATILALLILLRSEPEAEGA